MNLEYRDLYLSLREDLRSAYGWIWKTRAWAVALAGASAVICVRTLQSSAPSTGVIKDPTAACALVVTGGAIANLAFWYITLVVRKGVVRLGVYLQQLETSENLHHGWETLTVNRESSKQQSPWEEIGEDVPALLACLYLLLAIVLVFWAPSAFTIIALGTTLASLGVCSFWTLHFAKNFRQGTLAEVAGTAHRSED